MSVISFATSKGGAGKTTSTIILATTLARRFTVTVIDADPSPAERLLTWAGNGPLPDSIKVVSSQGERHIHDEIDEARKRSDFVIVDTEGAASRLNAYIMGESDLVIVPMGDEQPEAESAIETLAQLAIEARNLRRDIPVRILFTRTKAAVKSRLEKSLNAQVRDKIGSFSTELNRRTAFSSLYGEGGTLHDLDRDVVSGVDKAIENAELFVEELLHALEWIQDIHASENKALPKEMTHAR